jgi:hypothetical protein
MGKKETLLGEAYFRTVALSRIRFNLAACEIVGTGGAMYRSLGTARQSQGATMENSKDRRGEGRRVI